MLKFQLKSGKTAELNLASIDTALALYRAVLYSCMGDKIKLDKLIASMKTYYSNEVTDISMLDIIAENKEAILSIISSENVLEAIKACCDKVLYDKRKFSMEIFEDERARGDFFGLMLLVAVENLRPFFREMTMYFDLILSGVLKA